MPTIEALRRNDVQAALAIQAETYPPFLVEGEAVFLNRIDLSASYCLAAKQGDALLGYLLAHGWRRESPPSLGAPLIGGGPPEVLFIHDLAVSPAARGLDVGRTLVARASELAARDGLHRAELIAVEGAADYWRRLGFVECPASGNLRAKLMHYGTHARWMARDSV